MIFNVAQKDKSSADLESIAWRTCDAHGHAYTTPAERTVQDKARASDPEDSQTTLAVDAGLLDDWIDARCRLPTNCGTRTVHIFDEVHNRSRVVGPISHVARIRPPAVLSC